MSLFKKFYFTAAVIGALSNDATAQQVAKNIIAEHFTNTLCSICASRNPGLYANLRNYPQVLHVSFHPSSPYAGCTLSMANVTENDSRTNFYGLYGGTPRLTVQGLAVSGSFTDSTIFTSKLGKLTSFDMHTSISAAGSDSVSTRVVIKKVDTSSLTSLWLYGLVAEDTVSFTSGNGESGHYDVFRKSLWGTTQINITSLTSVGDSVVYSQTIVKNPAWNPNRLFTITILRDTFKNVVQAAKSARLSSTIATNSTNMFTKHVPVSLRPNPAGDHIFIEGNWSLPATVTITDTRGVLLQTQTLERISEAVNTSSFSSGLYFLHVNNASQSGTSQFLKK